MKMELTQLKNKERRFINFIQQLQLQAHKGGPVINKNKIERFISEVNYPISYFDFETFTDAVPIYDKQNHTCKSFSTPSYSK